MQERAGYVANTSYFLEAYNRQHDLDADMFRSPFAFKINPTNCYKVFFAANHVMDLQGHIDRDELFMREAIAYRPTPLTPDCCDPPLEDEHVDMMLGFNPFSPAYRVEHNDPTDTEHSGSESYPEGDAMSHHFEQAGYLDVEEDPD